LSQSVTKKSIIVLMLNLARGNYKSFDIRVKKKYSKMRTKRENKKKELVGNLCLHLQ
jgi:hypothetical protein